jgi:thioredoxin 1
MSSEYLAVEKAPTRDEIDQTTGLVLLEFGTDWCGFCRALAPQVEALLAQHPQVRHIRIMDGSGQKLGRSFKVKLWPNLVFLKDGQVLRQLARPSGSELKQAFEALAAAPAAR